MVKFRELLYKVGTGLFSIITLLAAFHVIDPMKTAALSGGLTTILGLFGVTVAGTAAYNITKQRKDGAFDPTAPADAVVNGVNAILEARQSAEAQFQKVQDAFGGLVSGAVEIVQPTIARELGPLASQILDQVRK